MKKYGTKRNVVASIFMFFFLAGEITKFYTNSKKCLLSAAINLFQMKVSIYTIHNETLEHTTNQESFWFLFYVV